MATRRIDDARCAVLDDRPPDREGRYVLYWMQAAQRARHNDALELAVQRANAHGVPLVVAACLIPDYPGANGRHLAFMLGGLARALREVERRGARPCLRVGDPVEVIAGLTDSAIELVLDRGNLRHQRRWAAKVVERTGTRTTQVETEVVVPVDLVSDHAESAARTIRPKLHRHLDRFVVDLATTPLDVRTTPQGTTSDLDLDPLLDPAGVRRVLAEHGLHDGPPPIDDVTPGTEAAARRLGEVLDRGGYADARNRFTTDGTTRLSPYLHFGQISPTAVAAEVLARPSGGPSGGDADELIEELVVRRELAVNHVVHEARYDTYGGLPEWARTTLDEHRHDGRETILTAAQLEAGESPDEVWNAVMDEIRERGWVHNQLRMYWGKQVLRWTNTPEHAHRTLRDLNDRYFLDGRDPSSYANVGWCFGLHDRPFQERAVLGKVRPFTTAALRRKDDLDAWLDRRREAR